MLTPTTEEPQINLALAATSVFNLKLYHIPPSHLPSLPQVFLPDKIDAVIGSIIKHYRWALPSDSKNWAVKDGLQ